MGHAGAGRIQIANKLYLVSERHRHAADHEGYGVSGRGAQRVNQAAGEHTAYPQIDRRLAVVFSYRVYLDVVDSSGAREAPGRRAAGRGPWQHDPLGVVAVHPIAAQGQTLGLDRQGSGHVRRKAPNRGAAA